MKREGLLEWLEANGGYRHTTAKQTALDVERLRRNYRAGRAVLDQCRRLDEQHSLGRYARFLEAAEPELDDAFDAAVREQVTRAKVPRGPFARERKKLAVRFLAEDWQRLVQALEDDKHRPEAIVLLVIARTGLRVGDVLRITRAALTEARKTRLLRIEIKGGREVLQPTEGAPDAWHRLDRNFRHGQTVAEWLCPNSASDLFSPASCPYKRVERHLHKLGKRLSIAGRMHTHRFRRTVAVQALVLTHDLNIVQQLLHHRSLASTMNYVDEFRRHDVAALQQKIREVP